MINLQDLHAFGIFNGLNDDELSKIAKLCYERTVEKGVFVLKQGNAATGLHLCRSGSVDIIVQLLEPKGMTVPLHSAGAGEVYGWSSLVKPNIYTASAQCVEKTEEFYIKAPDLLDLFKANARIGYVVMKNLSAVIVSRLSDYQAKLAVAIANDIGKEW